MGRLRNPGGGRVEVCYRRICDIRTRAGKWLKLPPKQTSLIPLIHFGRVVAALVHIDRCDSLSVIVAAIRSSRLSTGNVRDPRYRDTNWHHIVESPPNSLRKRINSEGPLYSSRNGAAPISLQLADPPWSSRGFPLPGTVPRYPLNVRSQRSPDLPRGRRRNRRRLALLAAKTTILRPSRDHAMSPR